MLVKDCNIVNIMIWLLMIWYDMVYLFIYVYICMDMLCKNKEICIWNVN